MRRDDIGGKMAAMTMIQADRYAREKTVTEKTEAILRSVLKATINKAFAGSSLKYGLSEVWDSYITDRKMLFNGLSIQKFLLELSINLSDWVGGTVYLGAENTAEEIKQLATITEVPVLKRTATFERICKVAELEYSIGVNPEALQLDILDYFKDIGGDIVHVGDVYPYTSYLRHSLVSENLFCN